MTNKKVAPPIFSNDVSYEFWKGRIQMWELVFGTPKNEEGIIVIKIFDW